jgi:hypothetical protein
MARQSKQQAEIIGLKEANSYLDSCVTVFREELDACRKKVETEKLTAEGYKNSNRILTDRIAKLESGDGNVRIRELEDELSLLRGLNNALHVQLSQLAEDAAHKREEEGGFYRKRCRELEEKQREILEILGHGKCDGWDHSYDWDY